MGQNALITEKHNLCIDVVHLYILFFIAIFLENNITQEV